MLCPSADLHSDSSSFLQRNLSDREEVAQEDAEFVYVSDDSESEDPEIMPLARKARVTLSPSPLFEGSFFFTLPSLGAEISVGPSNPEATPIEGTSRNLEVQRTNSETVQTPVSEEPRLSREILLTLTTEGLRTSTPSFAILQTPEIG